ncbi:hypothetical protein BU15DRAFT_60337 [Melanogaster broomeanus]|nr:hypothetical protein BU15DRAFT_60337 [Melanogaster broomeanus]
MPFDSTVKLLDSHVHELSTIKFKGVTDYVEQALNNGFRHIDTTSGNALFRVIDSRTVPRLLEYLVVMYTLERGKPLTSRQDCFDDVTSKLAGVNSNPSGKMVWQGKDNILTQFLGASASPNFSVDQLRSVLRTALERKPIAKTSRARAKGEYLAVADLPSLTPEEIAAVDEAGGRG